MLSQLTTIVLDSAACILMSENPVNRDRIRHVEVKFHFLRERVRAGKINLHKCWGPLNVADALTKMAMLHILSNVYRSFG